MIRIPVRSLRERVFSKTEIRSPVFNYRDLTGLRWQRWLRRQRERLKHSRLYEQKQQLMHHARFLYISVPSLHNYDVK